MELFRPGIKRADFGKRTAKVHHQHPLVVQFPWPVDAHPSLRTDEHVLVHGLGGLGDIQVLVGLADALVKEPRAPLPDAIDPLDLVLHLEAVELVDHAAAVHDLGAALAHHLVTLVQHGDLGRLEQADLQGQVEGVGADHAAVPGGVVGFVHKTEEHRLIVAVPLAGVIPVAGILRRDGPLEKVVQVDRSFVTTEEREVQEVVRRPQLEPPLATEQAGIGPDVRFVVPVKVLEHLLDDVAAFDHILGLGFVVRFGEADDVDNVRLHVHLPVGRYCQVPFSFVQVGRKVREATPSLLDDVKVKVVGQRLKQFVGRLELGQVVEPRGAGWQVVHHLHDILGDTGFERHDTGDDMVGDQ